MIGKFFTQISNLPAVRFVTFVEWIEGSHPKWGILSEREKARLLRTSVHQKQLRKAFEDGLKCLDILGEKDKAYAYFENRMTTVWNALRPENRP